MTTENDITFLEKNDSIDPITFFKWKNYKSQEDKQRAHSAYASLITKAQSTVAWKEHVGILKQLWEKFRENGAIDNFWRMLPKHASTQTIQKIQGEYLIKNIKRLQNRDNTLSETIDAGLIHAAWSNITPGISLPATASSTQPEIKVEDINDLLESQGSMRARKKHSRDQLDDNNSALQCTSQNPKQSRRVSFGRSLTLEDLRTPEYSSPKDGDVYDKPMPENLQSSVGSSLPSTDPDDTSYYTDQDLRESTSKIFTWNYLAGNGRVDSRVDNAWVIDNVEVGRGLMNFRDGVVRENGVMTKPYEKLVINFIFLIEAEYQAGGLQGKVEDRIWESLCDTVKDTVPPLSDGIVTEAHRWAHQLAQNNSEAFLRLLDDSPPQDRTLKTILTKMADTAQLWNTQMRNEDTYLKSLLGPFLDTYFGKVKYTKSDWTPVQDDTRNSELDLLIPDYATTTQVGEQQLYVVLLEGKVAKNKGLGQIWDDQTKLGQEMKAALDSILKLEPDGEVCVIGLLIREPLIEFYTMQVHAEATYIMHKFAASYIPPNAMNVFNLAHLMEVFAHARVKVEKTVAQIRQVKVHASPTPRVPLSWLRPSFKKPKLCHVADGQ